MVPESLDLLIVEKSSAGGAIQMTAGFMGLSTYLTKNGEKALQLLKERPDNLPKGILVDSGLTAGDRNLSLEIFQYLDSLGATENFRYTCTSKPEYCERETSLQEQTGAQFIIKGDIHGPLHDFMKNLAEK